MASVPSGGGGGGAAPAASGGGGGGAAAAPEEKKEEKVEEKVSSCYFLILTFLCPCLTCLTVPLYRKSLMTIWDSACECLIDCTPKHILKVGYRFD